MLLISRNGFYQIELFGLDLTIRIHGRNGGRQRPKIVFGKDWVAVGIGRCHIEFGRVMVSRFTKNL